MEILPISSYHEYCDPYVMEQYKTSTRLRALVDAMLSQCDDLETAFQEMRAMISPYDAVGPALDFIGGLIGVIRVPGQTDEDYRQLILMGNISKGLPTPEALRKFIQLVSGVEKVGLYPVWPAGLYFVLYGFTNVELFGLLDYMTSGADLVEGTFLRLEDGGAYDLLTLEDNGQPIVIDQRWQDTEYAMADDEGYLIVDDEDNIAVGIDYHTTHNEILLN